MALSLKLKSQERMILGDAVVCNIGSHSANLLIESEVPVLRHRDILPEREAATPCGRIYLVLQLFYVNPDRQAQYLALYVDLARDILGAAPSMKPLLEEISLQLAAGEFYKALRIAKRLLDAERVLLNASRSAPQSCQLAPA